MKQRKSSHLFLVSVTIDVFLQRLHPFEGVFVVDAVDEHKAVGKSVVMSGKLHPVPEPTGVVEAHLLSCPTVRLN